MATYSIKLNNGSVLAGFASHEDACCEVRKRWPNAAIGHTVDLLSGGDRTLCWADEESAANDAGARACAAIVEVAQ